MKEILYVEDNIDTANAVKMILDNVGFHVDLAYDGKTCLELAGKKNYDCLLLDIMLPDMSGWDIHEKLKGRLKSKFIFLSAIPVSSERLDELKSRGVSDYIMKPFIKADLVERVTKAIQDV